MDKNIISKVTQSTSGGFLEKHAALKIQRTIDALKKRNIDGYFADSHESLYEIFDQITKDDKVMSFAGTMTIFDTNLLDHMRTRDVKLLDRYAEGLSQDDIKQIYRETFFADTFVMSSNAITEDGVLHNVDGMGNRVAAMVYGPQKVIVVCGINKIVKDDEAAQNRIREIAAPINAMRVGAKTPCTTTGVCHDCSSPGRICGQYVTIRKQQPGRMHVIFLNENLGY